VSHEYIRVIKDIYKGGKSSVRMLGGVTSDLFVSMSLHQGSTLSICLFTLVMDELIKEIQDELPYGMLFAYDIVLIDEIKRELMASWSD